MIFTKGNLDSIVGVQKVFKSEFYCIGISKQMVEEIQMAIGFKCGSFPVRYLRVPLVTRRLSHKDCAPLIDKLKARINC